MPFFHSQVVGTENPTVQSLTFVAAGTSAWDASAGVHASLAMSGDTTLGAISGAETGRLYSLVVSASGADRTLTFNTAFRDVEGDAKDPIVITSGESRSLVFLAQGGQFIESGGAGTPDLTPLAVTNAESPVAAATGIRYLADTTGGAITLDIPVGVAGDRFEVADATGNFGTTAVTLDAAATVTLNGGAADGTLDLGADNGVWSVLYVDTNVIRVDQINGEAPLPIEAYTASTGAYGFDANNNRGVVIDLDQSALTVNAPANLVAGEDYEFVVTNTSGAAAAVTFNTAFKAFDGSDLGVLDFATGETRAVSFVATGTTSAAVAAPNELLPLDSTPANAAGYALDGSDYRGAELNAAAASNALAAPANLVAGNVYTLVFTNTLGADAVIDFPAGNFIDLQGQDLDDVTIAAAGKFTRSFVAQDATTLVAQDAAGGLAPSFQDNAAFTAEVGFRYNVATDTSAVTMTLPAISAAPQDDQVIELYDLRDSFGTNNLTITSTANINGSASDLVLDVSSGLWRIQEGTNGWRVYEIGAQQLVDNVTAAQALVLDTQYVIANNDAAVTVELPSVAAGDIGRKIEIFANEDLSNFNLTLDLTTNSITVEDADATTTANIALSDDFGKYELVVVAADTYRLFRPGAADPELVTLTAVADPAVTPWDNNVEGPEAQIIFPNGASADVIIGAVANPVAGQVYRLYLENQEATTNRTVTFNAAYVDAAGAGVGAIDLIPGQVATYEFMYNGTNFQAAADPVTVASATLDDTDAFFRPSYSTLSNITIDLVEGGAQQALYGLFGSGAREGQNVVVSVRVDAAMPAEANFAFNTNYVDEFGTALGTVVIQPGETRAYHFVFKNSEFVLISQSAGGTISEHTADFTAVPGTIHLVDTQASGGTVIVTPPASPVDGTSFEIVDAGNNAGTNQINVGFNLTAENFYTAAGDVFIINVDGARTKFIYSGNAVIGWIIA